MGDRANILIKSDDEVVCLYTNWSGRDLPGVVQDALIRGESRVNNFQYITRIIFSEMTRGCGEELAGYGITNRVHDGRELIKFDVDNQVIEVGDVAYSVDEYMKLSIDGYKLAHNVMGGSIGDSSN